ncbi:S9 family peptidase [Oceanobacillus halotolerans]|uniref:S9 family peptidase n=1 Tax=Oceanobacillus halotolerans TaxID=2663380 RepID=UPI0013DA3101|nr:alpha/beta fold hydrolase [Oceanobacillus halotolerans]
MTKQSKDETLLNYLTVHGAYQPSVIPNRQAFTFLSKETGIPQVWKWDETAKKVKQYTDLEDRILSVYHSPSGEKTIVGMDHKGNEKQQFYLLTDDGTNVEELVISTEHFHEFGGWSPDEKSIAFTSNRRHLGYFDLYVVDVETKKEEVIYEYDGKCTPISWTKDGKAIIVSIADSNIDNSIYVIDVHTKDRFKIGTDDVVARHHSVQLTKDGKGGFLVSDIGRDTMGIFQFTFENPSTLKEVYTVENWDIEEIKLSPSEGKLAFTVNEGGYSTLGLFDFTKKTTQTIEVLPKGVYASISWLTDEEFIVGVKSPVLPGDVYKIAISPNTAERITYVGQAESIEKQWFEPALYHFKSFDGLEVPYFYYGEERESQPVVVYVHGGPEHQIRAEYNPVIQYLAAQGFAVVAPNVRGSMGYGRKYVQLDDVRKRMDAVADLKWLVEDLVESHGAARDKVGIMGRSYGGFMVLAAVTHYPEVWAAGVDIVGISHFKTFLENTGPWRRKLREAEYGSLENDVNFFEEIAPLNHTDKITAPLLVFHGRNDTRVPVSEAEQLTADLKEQGKEVELMIFEDEGHQTEKIENHIEMNSKIVSFMSEKL